MDRIKNKLRKKCIFTVFPYLGGTWIGAYRVEMAPHPFGGFAFGEKMRLQKTLPKNRERFLC